MTIATKIAWSEASGTKTLELALPNDEQGFWREIASYLEYMPIPNELVITTPLGHARLDITQRGTYFKDGEERPSMFIVPLYNDIELLDVGTYEDAYLTCINPETTGGRGNYKFYHLHQLDDGDITAYYGRIGQTSGFGAKREIFDPLPSWMFELRKAEKLSKGYIDQTEIYLGGEISERGEEKPVQTQLGTLYAKLLDYAKNRVRSSLVQGTKVSSEQVKKSRELIRTLGQRKTVKAFNKHLMALMQISPRNVSYVEAELAKSDDDFGRIIDREESLLAAMEAVVSSKSRKAKKETTDGFAARGIEVYEVSGEEAQEAYDQIPHSLKKRVRHVYRVKPSAQQARHEDYLAKRNLTDKDIRLMWHGSRNENWCSIVEHSLMLNPNAQITGKMFGYGIYFGYDDKGGGAHKSWNYTSARGTYWAHGQEDTAFMGLYSCAYGKPYHPHHAGQYTKAQLDAKGCDCLHAQGHTCGLQYDEVVFYDEAAVCLKYLVEFNG